MHQLGEDGRWVKCRLGMAEGITAMAGQLAGIFSAVITRRVADNEAEAFKQTPATPARRTFNLQKTSRQIRSPTPSCLLNQPLVIEEATFGSFVVGPHPDDLDSLRGVIDLIHQAVLDVDAAGGGSGQISDEIFVWRGILERVLRDDLEKTLGLWPEV